MVQPPNSAKIGYNKQSGRLTGSLVHHSELVYFQNEETEAASSLTSLFLTSPGCRPGLELCNYDRSLTFKSSDGTLTVIKCE